MVPTVIKCLMYFRRGREAEEREKYLIDSEFTPFGLFNRGGWYRWYDTVNVKTLVNLLQTVWAACTRCGHPTWAVSPSGGDESRAVWGSFPLEEKPLGFLLVKYQSGAGFLKDLIKDYIAIILRKLPGEIKQDLEVPTTRSQKTGMENHPRSQYIVPVHF